MNLKDSIILAIFDKILIGGIVLIAGYWINKRFEKFKVETNRQSAEKQKIFELENQLALNRLNEELELIEKQISDFYWPIYLRLEKDNTMWQRISCLSADKNVLPGAASDLIEKEFILKNHQEIVEIVESKIYLAGNLASSEELIDELLKYIKHVAVYKTIRSVKELQKLNPISLNEPFPEKLFPLIEKKFHELQEKYEKLKRMKFVELKQD
jgi:hypothetical protein